MSCVCGVQLDRQVVLRVYLCQKVDPQLLCLLKKSPAGISAKDQTAIFVLFECSQSLQRAFHWACILNGLDTLWAQFFPL